MFLKRILAISASVSVVFASSAFADSLNVKYDAANEEFILSGTIDDISVTEMFAVTAATTENKDDEAYISFGYADGNLFDYRFKLPDNAAAGNYFVKITSYGGEGASSENNPVFLGSAEDKDGILKNSFSSCTNAELLKNEFDAKLKYFGLSDCDYFLLSDASRTKVASRLVNKLYSYENYRIFTDDFFASLGIEMLQNSEAENAEKIFEKYFEYFKLENELCLPIYSGEDTNVKNIQKVKQDALELFSSEDIDSLQAVKKYFNENLFLSAVSNIESYGEITYLFEVYSAAVPFDLSVYNKSDKLKTANYISSLGKNYKKMSTLESDINSAYNRQNGVTGGVAGGGTGGGSGTKSDSTGGFYTPGIVNSTELYGSFKDMSERHWAYNAVEALRKKGIVNGDDSGNFNPERTVTREEFAKMLVCAMGLYDENSVCEFTDISGDWSYAYVSSAVRNGIVSGIGGGLFGKGQNISRQDMAVMAARAAGFVPSDSYLGFDDSESISDYAAGFVGALLDEGCMKGFADNTFRPLGSATRAEAAMVIYNLVK